MAYAYSEDNFIEKTAIAIFKEMNWQVANVYQGERFGAGGTLGRASEADVVLRERFMAVVRALNPDLPEAAYLAAFEEISSDNAAKTLPDLNCEKYKQLKEGIPVDYLTEKGERVEGKRIRVFDFDEPGKNDFLAVQQMWIEGKSKRRKRPDIVGFVNGIPLVFIELKAHHRKLKVAFEENLSDYKDTIPHLFHCNAVIVLSNGFESKIGSLTSKFEHFHEWKRIRENEEGVVSLDTILKGVCEKSRLLDLFENFILFDNSVGKLVKLIARNHQFIGVNKAVGHFENQLKRRKNGEITKEEAQRLGVFWHTQGSGKSYSMVFLCQKIQRQFGGAYTFVLVTDRVELDKQIYGTFAGVGAVTNKKAKAGSGKELKGLLETDEKYIFTIINKFNFDGTVTERENIIVISDEAHRTQGGTLALNMRKALPNAAFIGFTGTPLFKDDELTRRIFGDYVSVYDFKRSIEDGATVPLYYENRGEKLRLDNPKINDEIRTAIEAAELDEDQTEKLKRLFAKDYPILTAEKRLRSIAKDVVEHFNNRGYKGKAMFVALDKLTAVRMFDYISEEQTKYIAKRKKEIEKLTDEQEYLTQAKALKWSEETEMAVVVSHEQNEIQRFTNWGLDIEPHRLKMNERDLEKDFKEDDHPFRFVIVCAMWLTGFDVKSLSTLYLDKPMKSHTLMQTIARANRVHDEWKNNGLIVDYIETYKALLEALAVYAIGGDKGGDGEGGELEPPVKPLEELAEDLKATIEATVEFLREDVEFDLGKAIETEGVWKIKAIQEGVNAVCLNDESRNKFGVLAREVFKKFKALFPDSAIYVYQPQRDAINAIYAVIYRNEEESDISAIVRQVQEVVDKSIESLNIALEPVEGFGNMVDLSGLDFQRIEKEFLKLGDNQPVAVQSLKDKIADKLNQMLMDNPFRVDYYERYQRIIEEYNTGKEYGAIKEIFDKLVEFYGDLSEEEKRAVREDLNEEELAVLDMLSRDKKISDKEKAELKEIAKQLLERLKANEFRVVNWFEKEQTKSAVRVVINNLLFDKLPYPTFEDRDIEVKTEVLFDFFKRRYDGRVAA